VHKYALSRITTAVDTALRITAVLRFSSFLLQLVTVIPHPPLFPQPDGSICCVSIYFTPHSICGPARPSSAPKHRNYANGTTTK